MTTGSPVSIGTLITTEPPGARMLEIAMSLETTSKLQFKSAIRLQDGSRTLNYADEKDTGAVKVPVQIRLRLPIFDHSGPTEVVALVRYRVKEAALYFSLVILNQIAIERAAFLKCVGEIESGSGVPVYLGTPEF